MQVISYTHEPHDQSWAIVRLEAREISRLFGTLCYDHVKLIPGQQIEIVKRYDHAARVMELASENKKLPEQLRAFATALETTIPAIDEIVDFKLVKDPE